MDYFTYKGNMLFAEDVSVADIARQHGTPVYVYSKATLTRHYRVFEKALSGRNHQVFYSVKANGNLSILKCLAELGAGFDIVSQGELERVLVAGGDPSKVIFSGVGKLDQEIERALSVGIQCFNVESKMELERIQAIASRLKKVASVAVRVNPDVDAKTHPYIATGLKENKFGVDIKNAIELYERAQHMNAVKPIGVACHIGSQLTTLEPFLAAFDRVYELACTLVKRGFEIEHIDMGGGLGVPYCGETPPSPAEYAHALAVRMTDRRFTLHLEPGRAIAANAGILVTRVIYLKQQSDKHFAVVDAAMNDLLRPALYQGQHDIVPVLDRSSEVDTQRYDVVGPVCETADCLGRDRDLSLRPEDFLAIRTVGAYGFVMSSHYNARRRPAEVMVDGQKTHLIRVRDTYPQLWLEEKATQAIPFTKMHGMGNDFVVVDTLSSKIEWTQARVRRLTDRHTGVGCDQLLVITPAPDESSDYGYRIFNHDGEEVEQCGNGARAVALYVHYYGLNHKKIIHLSTQTRIVAVEYESPDRIRVNMGLPSVEVQTDFVAVSMGNPHAVLSVSGLDQVNITEEAACLVKRVRAQFPKGVNVGFMQRVDKHRIRLRVFERGAGETLACGSGACAAVVSGMVQGVLQSPVFVELAGGMCSVQWKGVGHPVFLIGPAKIVFIGKYLAKW